MSVEFRDNSRAVLTTMETAKKKALTAIGQAAVEVTVDYMQSRYGRPIRQTGDLMRSIAFNVRTADDAVDVGSNLSYAPHVFLGTAKMPARPALQDALLQNTDMWKEIAAEYIGKEIKISVKT